MARVIDVRDGAKRKDVVDKKMNRGVTVRVLKMVLMAVVALYDEIRASNTFEGDKFKGVSMRHLRLIYPTDRLNPKSLRNALETWCDFGSLKKVEVAGEKDFRWVPSESGRKAAERMVFEDARLPLYYKVYYDQTLTDTNATYERVRDIVRKQMQLIIRGDDFWR
jgi:hypothetical protein